MNNASTKTAGLKKPSVFTKTNLLLGLVQGFYWIASCVFVSFLVRLLHYYGYNDYISGVVLMVSSIASILVQPLLGGLADRIRSVKWLIIGSLGVAAVSAWLLSMVYQNLLCVLVLIFVIFGSFRSQIYIIDLWSLRVGRDDRRFHYGFTRSFGSAFYAISAVLLGYSIDLAGGAIIIPIFIGMIVLDAAVILCVKEPAAQQTGRKEKQGAITLGAAGRMLMKNRQYVILLVSYCLIEMSSVPMQNYLTRKFETMGVGDFYVGLSFLIMGLLQIPTLLCMDQLHKRVTPFGLMLVSLFGIALRCCMIAFGGSRWVVVGAFCTEFFAFGLYIGTIHVYLKGILPLPVLYFGTTLYSAVSSGFGGILGNYLAGFLADSLGVDMMMYLLAIPGVCGLALFFFGNYRKRAGKGQIERTASQSEAVGV